MFCTTCGAGLEPSAVPAAGAPPGPPTPPPVQYYSPPPKQSALPIILIILAIVVVAIVTIAAIGFWWVTNEANSGNVDMTVNGWSEYSGAGEPAEGYDRIMVNVTMANHRSYDIPVTWYFFELQANGTEYRAAYGLQDGTNLTVPDNIPADQVRTFPVIFDIPEGADPTRLTYDIWFVDVSADIP